VVLQGALAFAPGVPAAVAGRSQATVCMSETTRRAALASFATVFAGVAPALAEGEAPVAEKPKPTLQPPDAYKLKKDYPKDARMMLNNMVIATELARGTPQMEEIVKSTRSEMNDFVAFYRRQPKVAGMPSFSTMYTAINTLSGHYASYGNKYPVPEKRRVRLKQQYKEIERALARGK